MSRPFVHEFVDNPCVADEGTHEVQSRRQGKGGAKKRHRRRVRRPESSACARRRVLSADSITACPLTCSADAFSGSGPTNVPLPGMRTRSISLQSLRTILPTWTWDRLNRTASAASVGRFLPAGPALTSPRSQLTRHCEGESVRVMTLPYANIVKTY